MIEYPLSSPTSHTHLVINMKHSKMPENTNGVVCYYNPASIVLEQRTQGKLEARKELLSINRKTNQLVTRHPPRP